MILRLIMKDKIVIKKYSDKYKQQIKNLIGKTLVDISVINKKDLPIDDSDLDKIKETYLKDGNFWIALKNNQVIRTVAVKSIVNNIAKLNRMFVLTHYHGTRVGQRLLDCALDFAREKGFKNNFKYSYKQMYRAHKFYEKNGFKRIETGVNKYKYEKILG